MDQTETESKVQAALKSDPSIDTIMSLGALSSGDPVIRAVGKLNAYDKYKIATFDLSPIFLKAAAEKKALFLLDQQQFLQGYLGVATLALYYRYGLMNSIQ
jgi:simple sugar transport system substrate-binding protein